MRGLFTLPATARVLLAGVATLTLAAHPARAQSSIASAVRRDTLPNGLTIIVVENHAVPLATAHVVFRGGAMTQTDELEGVPHLFEHMLFRAYGADGEGSFDAAASQQKAQFNGATSDEEVSYTLWFPSDQLGGAIGLMADLVRDPNFTERHLQVERFVVRNEMQRNQSQPSYLLDETTRRALWGSWFSRKNPIGNDMALFSVTPARLKELYDTWYVPNNAALVVTGDVNAEKVLSEARKAFGRWKRRGDPMATNPIPAPPPLDSTLAFVFTHDVQTVTVNVSWRGPTELRDSADVLDAVTLASIVNAEDSPFQRALLDNGLFQSAYFSADVNRHSGELRFTGTTTVERLGDALGAFGTAIGMMAVDGYFDTNMIEDDARRDRTAIAIAFEEAPSLADGLGSVWAARRLDSYIASSDPATQRRITPESLQQFAMRWLAPSKPYVIGVLTPASAERAVSRTVAQYIAFMKP